MMWVPDGEAEHDVPPEWLGYLAAFDTFIDAQRRDDEDRKQQARTMMGWFGEALIDVAAETRAARRLDQPLAPVLELLAMQRAA